MPCLRRGIASRGAVERGDLYVPEMHRRLYALCFVAVPLYYVYKVPILGNLLRVVVPMSRQRSARERVLETFDYYSLRYQSKHTFPEVHGWFVEAGFRDIRIFDPPVTVIGRRPMPGDG